MPVKWCAPSGSHLEAEGPLGTNPQTREVQCLLEFLQDYPGSPF